MRSDEHAVVIWSSRSFYTINTCCFITSAYPSVAGKCVVTKMWSEITCSTLIIVSCITDHFSGTINLTITKFYQGLLQDFLLWNWKNDAAFPEEVHFKPITTTNQSYLFTEVCTAELLKWHQGSYLFNLCIWVQVRFFYSVFSCVTRDIETKKTNRDRGKWLKKYFSFFLNNNLHR